MQLSDLRVNFVLAPLNNKRASGSIPRTMNLATPAPKVESAQAEPAPRESTTAAIEPARAVQPAVALAAPQVDAARPYDNPRQHAPPSVSKTPTGKSFLHAQLSWGVEALRANASRNNTRKGTLDFEAYAAVIQGPPQKNIVRRCLPCIFDERDFIAYGEVKYFVAVWEQFCFVYAEESSQQPYFVVDLTLYVAVQEDPSKPDPKSYTVSPEPDTNKPRPTMITILLKSKKDFSQAYQFSFETKDDSSLAERFLDAIRQAEDKNEMTIVEGVIDEEAIFKSKGKD